MARFLVIRAPGPAWDPARHTREQTGWKTHAAFMDALADEHFVSFGGPTGDEKKVFLVVDAVDEPTIRARLALDPWEADAVLRTVAVEPWTIWLGADERLSAARGQPLFLVGYVPGPRWDDRKDRREQPGWDAHGKFMDALAERGRVVVGGPIDHRRAVVVTQFDDATALHRELAADPWHNGILTIEYVEPWTLLLHA
jgi:uncharacterized protein YciI